MRADAQLERGAVRDQLGDMLADPTLDVADRRRGVHVGRDVDLDPEVDLATWMKLSPSVRGIARLTWAMTVVAARTAARVASTDVPERAEAVRSGGVTLTSATSSGSAPLGTGAGRPTGRPGRSRRAPRRPRRARSAPMNSARWRKWPAISGARCGAGPSMWRWIMVTSCSSGRARHERLEQHGRRRGRAMDVDMVAGTDRAGGLGRATSRIIHPAYAGGTGGAAARPGRGS